MNKADPRIFLLAYLLFFALGSRVLSEGAAIAVVIGGMAFAAGLGISGRMEIEEKKINIRPGVLYALFLFSIAAVAMDIQRIGGLPILNPQLLPMHKAAYVMAGLLSVPAAALLLAGNAKKQALAIPIAAVILTILVGYRTNIIASILAFSLILYASNRITKRKLLALLGVGLLLLLGASWIKVMAAGSGANPIEALFYRAEGTTSIFARITDTTPIWGSAHGKILQSAFSSLTGGLVPGPLKGPRTIMAETFGARENITFTTSILGEPYLDFGAIGVIVLMLLLGLLLGGLSKMKEPPAVAAYSVLLSYALVEIETGILDMIIFYYLAAGAYLLANARIQIAKTK